MRADADGLPRWTVMVLGIATLPGKQRMLRDHHRRIGHIPPCFGLGDHLRLRKGHLPREDLHPLDAHSAVTRLGCRKTAHCIRPLGRVLFFQRQAAGRGLDGHILGIALGIGMAHCGKAIPRNGDPDPFHRGRLTGRKGLDA